MSKRIGLGLVPLLLLGASAHAGMTVYDLNDVVRLRLQDISFFGLVLVLASFGVWCLWNYLAKDFPRLPRLSFFKAASLTGLLGLMMLLVLIMISGARELLTPGAWYRQGSHYRPNDVGNLETRQQALDGLKVALLQYAHTHKGEFPPHDYVFEIPAKLWEAPDSTGTRYLYFAGNTLSHSNAVLVCEPKHFGQERLVLFASGQVSKLSQPEIYRLLGVKEQ